MKPKILPFKKKYDIPSTFFLAEPHQNRIFSIEAILSTYMYTHTHTHTHGIK